jgi:aminoglycoside phosphotransferase
MLMRTDTPPDPTFPGLDAALDPQWAARGFADMLDAQGFPTHRLDCAVERVRIKRGRKVLIGYRLTGIAADGAPIDQRAMLSLFPDNAPARLKHLCRGPALVTPSFGPPTATVAALGGQAWFFPNDRKVHGIDALLTDLPGAVTAAGRVTACDIVHYVPEQGCTIRVAVEGGALFYGKCRADDRGATAWAVHHEAATTKGLRIAEALAHDPARRIFWQRAVAGVPLDPVDVRARPAYWAPLIGEALAAFEAVAVGDRLTRLEMGRIVETVTARAARSAAEMSALAGRLAGIGAQLRARRPDGRDAVLLHCDLHPGNLLWDGQSFALIDLDTAATGPRGIDQGSLVAALIHNAIEAQARDVVIDRMIAAFRITFGKYADFDWFVAASLIGERLYRCGTRRKSPSRLVRERLLAQAERLLARHG